MLDFDCVCCQASNIFGFDDASCSDYLSLTGRVDFGFEVWTLFNSLSRNVPLLLLWGLRNRLQLCCLCLCNLVGHAMSPQPSDQLSDILSKIEFTIKIGISFDLELNKFEDGF